MADASLQEFGIDYEPPTKQIYRTTTAVPADEPNYHLFGRVFGSDNDQEAHRRRITQADFITQRLLLVDHDYDSYLQLTNALHWHDHEGNYRHSTLSVFFNDQNLSKDRPVSAIKFKDAPAATRNRLVHKFGINLTNARVKDYVENGHLHIVTIPYTAEEKHGIGLFTPNNWGSMNGEVSAMRLYYSQPADVELLIVSPNVTEEVKDCAEAIHRVQGYDPIRMFFKNSNGPTHTLKMNNGEFRDRGSLPAKQLGPQITFKSVAHLTAIHAYGTTWDYEDTKPPKGIETTMHLLPISGCGSRRVQPILNWNADCAWRPHEGDTVYLVFNGEENRKLWWHARVIEPSKLASVDQITLTARRPKQQGQYITCDPEIEPSLPLDQLTTLKETLQRLAGTPLISVTVHPTSNDAPCKQTVRALQHIAAKGTGTRNTPKDPYFETLIWMLKGGDLMRPPHEKWEHPSLFNLPGMLLPQQGALKEAIKQGLIAEQQECVDMCTTIFGGRMLISGSAGTGKSALMILMAIHIALSGQQVLITTPMNELCDRLWLRLVVALENYKAAGTGGIRKIIAVRVHSRKADESVCMQQANIERLEHLYDANPEYDESDRQDLSALAIAAYVAQHDANQQVQIFECIKDDRVRLITASLGKLMAIRGAVIPAPPGLEHFPNPDAHRKFQNLYFSVSQGNTLTSSTAEGNEALELRNASRELRKDTLQAVDIILTTNFVAGTVRLTESIKPHTVFMDEAGKVREGDHLVIEARYRTATKIYFGDPRQLQPFCVSKNTNPFALQIALSLMARLMLAGVPYKQLKVQHRFCTQLEGLQRSVFGSQITRSPTLDNTRANFLKQVHQDMTAAVHGEKYQVVGSNLLISRLPKSECRKTTANPSKFNFDEVRAVVWLTLRYKGLGINMADLLVVTPYEAQYTLLKRCLSAIGENEGWATIPRVVKFDGVAGDEADVVIASLVIDKRTPLGFLTNGHRINAGLSRARIGLNTVTNRDPEFPYSTVKLDEVLVRYEECQWDLPVEAMEQPECLDDVIYEEEEVYVAPDFARVVESDAPYPRPLPPDSIADLMSEQQSESDDDDTTQSTSAQSVQPTQPTPAWPTQTQNARSRSVTPPPIPGLRRRQAQVTVFDDADAEPAGPSFRPTRMPVDNSELPSWAGSSNSAPNETESYWSNLAQSLPREEPALLHPRGTTHTAPGGWSFRIERTGPGWTNADLERPRPTDPVIANWTSHVLPDVTVLLPHNPNRLAAGVELDGRAYGRTLHELSRILFSPPASSVEALSDLATVYTRMWRLVAPNDPPFQLGTGVTPDEARLMLLDVNRLIHSRPPLGQPDHRIGNVLLRLATAPDTHPVTIATGDNDNEVALTPLNETETPAGIGMDEGVNPEDEDPVVPYSEHPAPEETTLEQGPPAMSEQGPPAYESREEEGERLHGYIDVLSARFTPEHRANVHAMFDNLRTANRRGRNQPSSEETTGGEPLGSGLPPSYEASASAVENTNVTVRLPPTSPAPSDHGNDLLNPPLDPRFLPQNRHRSSSDPFPRGSEE